MPDLTKNPGESCDEFIARIVATASVPSDEAMEELRRLLPPVSRPLAGRMAS